MPVVHCIPKGLLKERFTQLVNSRQECKFLVLTIPDFATSFILYQLMSFNPYFDLYGNPKKCLKFNMRTKYAMQSFEMVYVFKIFKEQFQLQAYNITGIKDID